MRRALSILLVLLFGAGPLSFAFSLSDDISLPACCRRLGAHHCAMDSPQSHNAPGNALKAHSRCQQYPQHPNARTSSHAANPGSSDVPIQATRKIRCSGPTSTGVTSIHLRIPVLRGPPATHLS
jgi:hypothetical protein